MTLKSVMPSLDEANSERADFTRRFRWTQTAIVTVLAMFGDQLGWMAMTAG